MILALDIGNTHIVLGCMEGRRIRYLCRMATNRLTTGAEYAVTISRLLEFGHIAPDAFDGAIISSVVPQVTRSLSEAVKMLTGVEPMVVGPGHPLRPDGPSGRPRHAGQRPAGGRRGRAGRV